MSNGSRKGNPRGKLTPDIPALGIQEQGLAPEAEPQVNPSLAPSPRIERDNPLYGVLYPFWFQAGSPAGFNFNGDEYIVINDSGTVFIRQGRQNASERYYGHLSMGRSS